MLKKIAVASASLLFLISLFLGIDRFAHHPSNHAFAEKIASHHPYASAWDISVSEEEQKEVNQILSQKFTYYSKGAQSYVFLSEDKQYILKFFKQQKLRPSSWLGLIPLSFNPYYHESLFKEKKYQATYGACKTAFVELKKESGLIYVHLNPTRHLNRKVILFDKNGKQHMVDVNKTGFYVQKRAQLIYSRISELMHDGDIAAAKKIICSVFELIHNLGQKGVVDNDPVLRKNFGLIDDVAVQIDLGKLRIDPERKNNFAYKKDIRGITHNFKIWIEKNYPQLFDHFNECLEKAAI